jgi:hypothetical protein
MALDVKYLRGTRAQYEAYEAASKLVDHYYYLITNTDGSIDLYIGKVKLSNNADLVAAVASLGKRIDDVIDLIEALDDRVEALETDVAYLKENAGHKFYEVSALPAFAEGHTYKEGDVCIVTEVKEGVSFKTAYHCIKNAEGAFAWAAMAGNYNAANVYYDKNIQVTKTVGNIETSNNKPVDLQFKGKNMEQIWQYLYATEDKSMPAFVPPVYSIFRFLKKLCLDMIALLFPAICVNELSVRLSINFFSSKSISDDVFSRPLITASIEAKSSSVVEMLSYMPV